MGKLANLQKDGRDRHKECGLLFVLLKGINEPQDENKRLQTREKHSKKNLSGTGSTWTIAVCYAADHFNTVARFKTVPGLHLK